jgi:hypothetical protein
MCASYIFIITEEQGFRYNLLPSDMNEQRINFLENERTDEYTFTIEYFCFFVVYYNSTMSMIDKYENEKKIYTLPSHYRRQLEPVLSIKFLIRSSLY